MFLIIFLVLTLICGLILTKIKFIGIQVFDHIYKFNSVIQYPGGSNIDIILIYKHFNQLNCYSLFGRKSFIIPLAFVGVGFHLKYIVDEKEKKIPFEEGTPFKIDKGVLVLYKVKRKGLGFIKEEVKRSQSWPML